ncbi:MAG TPA: S8 family serine peptidase [Streptosporangiaceae bacterium]|nr:S8 family serine peptidase [Streptosporangiaceae bacterium]
MLTLALSPNASAAPAMGMILSAGGPGALDGQYLVVLKDNAGLRSKGVTSVARGLAERHDGTVGYTYQRALRGFSVRMSEREAKELAANPAVSFVEQDHEVHIFDVQQNPPSWGLDRIDQRNLPLNNAYNFDATASNVHAYVIDTGVRITHQTFGGRASNGRDTVSNDNVAQDGNGHGTHVAGTIAGSQYGVAKGAQIVAVRVLNNSGSGTTAGVVAGIDWVTANAIKPAVANMSLGGGADATLDNAVSNSINSGITYAIAAGNGDLLGRPLNACTQSPARVPAAITVGATQQNDAKASFSNIGTCLDIFAPGVGITSSWNTSDTATNTISGTSMATPHVAGAAALILAGNPSASPQQVRDTMVNNATTGVVGSPGTGSPNRLLFTGTGANNPPAPTGCSATNGTDTAIPDAGAAVTSSVTIADCTRTLASSTSTAEVHINHSYRGDLVIDLVAPDGTSYRLKNSSGSDGADDVHDVYTANVSAEGANGTWQLRVQDVFAQDTGTIDTWTLTV